MDEAQRPRQTGGTARSKGRRRILNSRRIAALPILEHCLDRLRLREFLREHLPHEDGRTRVPTATALLVLLRNLLISREPLYGVGEWAARYEPHLLGLSDTQLAALNDDRIGRALDRLFDANIPALALQVAAHAIREFDVSLDQLHNDSTTITFHGSYESAERERTLRQRLRLAVTWGHNKDHRPDLKQLLYILTVTGDGAIPVQFRVESGNATDDRSHQGTWDLLCQLTGHRDFLYIADCKLATTENMAYLHQRGGRFLSTLPRTRSEDAAFRAVVVRGDVQWRRIHEKYSDEGQLVDRFSICEPAGQTVEGYRLIWYHSTRKAELDAEARLTRLEKALKQLDELRAKLASPRTRFRSRAKVAEAVEALLRDCEVTEWITVQIEEQVAEKYRQERRGRPGEKTRYIREEKLRFALKHRLELERLDEEARGDGIFPLVSNDRSMTERELLLAYKQQPAIERRFEHLKTDFVVAPMYLKEVSRIQALLCVYFFVLLVEALLERELRRAMERKGIQSLPLYSEARACRRPTARKVIDLYEDVQRHTLRSAKRPPEVFSTELTRLQRKVLRLLGMPRVYEI
ncbi:MAG: IS1634 family transposase [Planctomycetaceae bacterium]|nr:IS1634 family transposase [Planctomycetaceae bacterium]